MINLVLLVILIGVTYFVAMEGPQGAAVTLFAVLFSGLIAMNFFEPLAFFFSSNFMGSFEWQHRWDVIALLLLFAGGVTLIRLMGDKLFPTYAEVGGVLYEISRWGLGLVTGYITMSILLTALHVAPLPREFMDFTPEGQNFLGFAAPDRQWLAFTQYVSESSLKLGGTSRIFDGAEFPAKPSDNSTQRIWSSFPIRYAARREMYTTGGRSAATTTLPPGSSNPPPVNNGASPSTGAGGF